MKKEKPTTLRTGQRVRWNTSQGRTTGRVVKPITKPAAIKGYRAAAAPDHPEYIVQSQKSGKRAAHSARSLRPAPQTPSRERRKT
jgi:hypothetical protein